MFESLWKDEEGLTTLEYALLLAIVAIVVLAGWSTSTMRARIASAKAK